MRVRRLLFMAVVTLLFAANSAHAWSAKCAIGITDCVVVQGEKIPVSDAEAMLDDCRDFTRNNIGMRALRMSVREILDVSGGRVTNPLLRAHVAYESLHDSPLDFDRSLPIEQRYFPVRRACAQVFRDMRAAPPSDEN